MTAALIAVNWAEPSRATVYADVKEGADVPEEARVDEIDEMREELDELDVTSKVVEEAKVDEPIVEFWQTARAAIPSALDKIEVLILIVTTSQRGVRINEGSSDRVRNCLGEKISMNGIALVISYIEVAHTEPNIMSLGVAEQQLIGPPA